MARLVGAEVESCNNVNKTAKGIVMEGRYVVRHGKDWASTKAGATRVSKVFKTQAAAVAYTRAIAREEGVELRIQDRYGQFRQCDSHGHDPRSIRG